MKARFGIVAIVLAVCLLFTGTSALATDFVWGCDFCTASTSWTGEGSWAQGSDYPDDANDNASITSAGFLIEYDPGSDLTINDLTLTGDDPTWRKLHIKDGALTVHDLELNNYAELDIDEDLTVNNEMLMDGFLTISVVDGATLAAVDLSFNGDLAQLDLKASTSGIFRVDSLTLDARGAGSHRQLVLDGGGTLTLGSSGADGTLTLYSDRDVDDNRGKLWLQVGSSVVWDADANDKTFRLVGGATYIRRADIDLDVDMTIPTSGGHIVVEGYARIEPAAGKTMSAPKLTIGDENIESRLHVSTQGGPPFGLLDIG